MTTTIHSRLMGSYMSLFVVSVVVDVCARGLCVCSFGVCVCGLYTCVHVVCARVVVFASTCALLVLCVRVHVQFLSLLAKSLFLMFDTTVARMYAPWKQDTIALPSLHDVPSVPMVTNEPIRRRTHKHTNTRIYNSPDTFQENWISMSNVTMAT